MTEISNQFLCAVFIIILAITIPQYIQLPTVLELLFHDKIIAFITYQKYNRHLIYVFLF